MLNKAQEQWYQLDDLDIQEILPQVITSAQYNHIYTIISLLFLFYIMITVMITLHSLCPGVNKKQSTLYFYFIIIIIVIVIVIVIVIITGILLFTIIIIALNQHIILKSLTV